MGHGNQIALLMGPTGSGKSALALAIAAARPTVIINADAMQLVGALRVITARPSEQEEAQAEHALYGVLRVDELTHVGRWLTMVEPVVRCAWAERKLPLLVGGTGMYIQSLKQGLAVIPPVPDAVREPLRALTAAEVRARLEVCDPTMAAKLKPGDSQRNLRALEVLEATGKSLAWWQEQGHVPLFPQAVFSEFYIKMDKPVLYPRLDARFMQMMEMGALDEVRSLMAIAGALEKPIGHAHGVPELAAHLRGEVSLQDAIAKAQQNTRNYAKRQHTWIRNQMQSATALSGDVSTMLKIFEAALRA